jgi:hypothetical protein
MAEGQLIDKELEESRKKIAILEKEKQELSEKSKGLADIIESLSSEKDVSQLEGMIGNKLKEMAEQIDLKVRKIEETSGNKDLEVKKQVASLMKERVDPKLGEISDKLKDLEKLKDLGDKIAQINDRLSSPLYQPKQPGAVSQGLSSFGEQIDFEAELADVKKTLENIGQNLATMSKRVEYRLSSAEDKLKELDKLKDLEDKYREINDKLGAENIQKLKKIVFSSDELIEEIIPETVNRKMRKRVEPIINSLKANRDFSSQIDKKVSSIEDDITELKKFKDTIIELRLEKDKLYKKFAEEESRFLEGLEILKMNIRKRMEKMMEKYENQLAKMQDFASPKTIEKNVKDIVLALFENRFQDIEKHLILIDEKAKALTEKDRNLGQMIEEAEAPENLRKWVADQTKDIERKLYYDVQGLKKDMAKNSDFITTMRERQKTFEAGMNDISKKMSDQVTTVNKVIDLKDVYAKRTEFLTAGMKSLDSKIAAERERTIILEQNLKEAEARFDKVSESIEIVKKIISEIKPLKERLAENELTVKAVSKRLSDKETLAMQVRKLEAEMLSMREKQAMLESHMAADRTRLESMLSNAIVERKQVEDRIKKEKVKVGELLRELKQ